MLDLSNYDPRPLRVRLMGALTYPIWLSVEDLSKKLGDSAPTISAMLSKMYLYGGPIERQRASFRHNKFVYRFKPVTKT